jgi:ABC-2 type transport system permease protein
MALLPSRFRAQLVKEFLSILRDPRARALLIGPPLMQLMVFSFAATLEVRNVSIAVYDRDSGYWSHTLVADLEAAGFIGRLQRLPNAAQLHAALERRDVLLTLEIPEYFSRDLAAGRPAALQVIVDGRRANSGQVALSYVESVVSRMAIPAALADPLFIPAAPIAVRHWFNPNLTYQWFVVPSLSGILAMFTSLIVTALSIARERELGTFDQLLVSPSRPLEIIVAKTIPALVIGTLLGMLMVTAGVFGFGIPFTGSLPMLLLSMMLFILSVVGIGLMISSVCATQQQAILGTFAVGVPMILMSGFATPVENMPLVLQWIAEAIPLKHFLVIAQGTFLKGLPAHDVAAQIWPMLLTACVTLSGAVALVRSRLQ